MVQRLKSEPFARALSTAPFRAKKATINSSREKEAHTCRGSHMNIHSKEKYCCKEFDLRTIRHKKSEFIMVKQLFGSTEGVFHKRTSTTTNLVGFVNGGLLDGEPREYLHRAGKLIPSSLFYFVNERHDHMYIYESCEQNIWLH